MTTTLVNNTTILPSNDLLIFKYKVLPNEANPNTYDCYFVTKYGAFRSNVYITLEFKPEDFTRLEVLLYQPEDPSIPQEVETCNNILLVRFYQELGFVDENHQIMVILPLSLGVKLITDLQTILKGKYLSSSSETN